MFITSLSYNDVDALPINFKHFPIVPEQEQLTYMSAIWDKSVVHVHSILKSH